MKIAITIVIGLVILVVVLWLLKRSFRRSWPKLGEIAASNVLQEKYGLYAENRPKIELAPAKIPENLRHLIPFAEKWGVGDDIIRYDCVEKATAKEKRELHDALYEPYERVTKWLDSFHTKNLSAEAAAFMYMQLALDEMGIYILEEKKQGKENTEQSAGADGGDAAAQP